MICDFCGEDRRKAGNKTCGDDECRRKAARQTWMESEAEEHLRRMRTHYGDDNPWTAWLKKGMGR